MIPPVPVRLLLGTILAVGAVGGAVWALRLVKEKAPATRSVQSGREPAPPPSDASSTAAPAVSQAAPEPIAPVQMASKDGQPMALVPLNVPGVSEERLSEFTSVLSLTNLPERLGRFAALLATLTKPEATAMRRLFHNFHIKGTDFQGEWDAFWERWGEIDPIAALENTAQFSPKDGWVRECARRAAKGWARRDPAATVVWLNAHQDDPFHESAFIGYLSAISDRDLTGATQTVLKSLAPDDPLLPSALNHLADAAIAQGQLTGLTHWFDQLPPDTGEVSARRLAVEHVWSRMQRADGIERTAEWIAATAAQPWRNDRLLSETARKYAEQKPAEAMAWAAGLPPSPTDGLLSGVDQVARRWAKTDPGALERWLREHAGTSAAEQASAAYAAELAKTDATAAPR